MISLERLQGFLKEFREDQEQNPGYHNWVHSIEFNRAGDCTVHLTGDALLRCLDGLNPTYGKYQVIVSETDDNWVKVQIVYTDLLITQRAYFERGDMLKFLQLKAADALRLTDAEVFNKYRREKTKWLRTLQ